MNDIVERLKPDTNQLDARESNERLAAVMAQRPGAARRGRVLLAAGGIAAALCIGATLAINSVEDGGSGSDPAEHHVGESECQPRLRLDNIVYLGVGYLEGRDAKAADVTPVGRGELATCDDEGISPQGSQFSPTHDTVPAFTFAGHPKDLVVGIVFPSGYEVYVAESVPTSERHEILERLASAK